MRPRVFPAEDIARSMTSGSIKQASMRPRVFPAEDWTCSCRSCHGSGSFNEAAGIPRGRRSVFEFLEEEASSFNEAAGIPRGRRAQDVLDACMRSPASMRPRVRKTNPYSPVFNEAAGIPRGRRARHGHHRRGYSKTCRRRYARSHEGLQ